MPAYSYDFLDDFPPSLYLKISTSEHQEKLYQLTSSIPMNRIGEEKRLIYFHAFKENTSGVYAIGKAQFSDEKSPSNNTMKDVVQLVTVSKGFAYLLFTRCLFHYNNRESLSIYYLPPGRNGSTSKDLTYKFTQLDRISGYKIQNNETENFINWTEEQKFDDKYDMGLLTYMRTNEDFHKTQYLRWYICRLSDVKPVSKADFYEILLSDIDPKLLVTTYFAFVICINPAYDTNYRKYNQSKSPSKDENFSFSQISTPKNSSKHEKYETTHKSVCFHCGRRRRII